MNKNYDLVNRVEIFGTRIISFSKLIPKNVINLPLISQFIRSGTSVGANYCEADDAESRKDYIHKVGIAKKEARETAYWLKMIVVAEPKLKEEAMKIYQEAKELNLIMNAIVRKASIKTD
ncbi:MAG TPA: four helix bundle protein [Candidatus Woesebacteria bacterium]|nr:four helix bundle protein [Candidatus Woesebacteria bacterium]